MKTNSQANYLFVYGTLRKEFGLQLSQDIKEDVVYVDNAMINGELYDIGEYPAALPTQDKNSTILGELYQVKHPRRVFRLLDEYEGYNKKHLKESEYFRKKETLTLENGKSISAWVYWYNFPVNEGKRIWHSDYLQYLKDK